MFEKELQEKIQKIFGVEKVTYDAPGESVEQLCIFIDIENSKNTFKDGQVLSMVTGRASMSGPAPKIPFGFFSKAIIKAEKALTKDLFFYDIETNAQRMGDIIQRGFSFVYFFRGQHDPKIGTITSVTISIEES